MPTKKPTDKNTKAEILQAYEELAKEKVELKSQIEKLQKSAISSNNSAIKDEPKVENKPTIMNQASNVQQKMNSTIENLVKIQLGFGSAASELSEQLTTRASKLEEISQSLKTESKELKELHALEVSEDTLDNLIATYEENYKAYQEEYNQQYEALSQSIQEQRKAWEKEQEEHKRSLKERNDNLSKNRQRDNSEYKYDLELQRKLETEEYEQQQKGLYKELEESRQEIEKQWTEREKTISEQEKQFEESKAKVEAFPKEKEAAIKKATEEGKGIAHYQAKIKADMFAKEVEGQKRFYEQRLQSLEQTIGNQESRIQNLSKQLESALKQVQDLAVKAIEGTANVNSYQAMKEIALEQAKSQVKNK
ncbi:MULTISPECIES: coiled-coil domain-containing protein [Nostocales]|uniref:Myosin heavy chain n=4 Tax=Nostocales TaxID=1161 RepID=A0A8S9T6S1_9CYAN|nr:hypothetical protein [Tolypothrix bouteillei]KAF3887123.1 hypothetical protein DA73_0400017725 [Tolypothrix bouteillei VB521301]